MPALSAADWLDVWEHSRTLAPVLQPCALLAPLLPDGQPAAQQLAIGRRDALLLELNTALFGPQLNAVVPCPGCGEVLELALSSEALRQPLSPLDTCALQLDWLNYRVDYRLVCSDDLATLDPDESLEEARERLLRRCVLSAEQDGVPIRFEQLPDALRTQLVEAMATLDPQAALELELVCPSCSGAWREAFDIGGFLLESLGQWAERTLDQVHLLAHSYGWSEAQVLALSPARRASYLARVLA
ncbi:MAG: hypothetical protein ABWY06_21225 [Pseudomonas sp.]|uniref:hypothetical protein n=1 Tax=Pseudomonas sp. TaxID=306 RepID=UPI003391B610